MKIVNFSRFIISISILACIVSFFISLATSEVYSAETIEYNKIIVAKGDTLWGIASKLEGDVNKNVYEIKEKNNLKNSMIYEGQELIVAIKK